ncbi:MAG: polysaccharide deacetylase family protein [Chthoniobacteraceae bacterium]
MPTKRCRRWIRPCLLVGNVAAPVAMISTWFQVPWLIAATILLHGCFCYAVVAPNCDWFGPVVSQFATDQKEVWLTIDDGPAGAETQRLAAELRARGAVATFFVQGRRLAQDPKAAAEIQAAGCTLANHTQTHPTHAFYWLRRRTLREEIAACSRALNFAGIHLQQWFRSPVGLKHVWLHRELDRAGLRLIGWSVRGRDGVSSDPEVVARRVVARVHPGAIIVLHEGKPRSVEGILGVVDALQERGYTFVIPGDYQLL